MSQVCFGAVLLGLWTLRCNTAAFRKFNQLVSGYFTPALGTMPTFPSSRTATSANFPRDWRRRCIEDEFLASAFASPALCQGSWQCPLASSGPAEKTVL